MGAKRDDIYKALAEPHRREILALLCGGPQRAGELARQVKMAPNAVSFHLRWLRSAGLVSVEREGRFLWYRVEPTSVAAWQAEVREQFQPGPQAGRNQEKAGVRASRPRDATKQRAPSKRGIRPIRRPSRPRQARSEDIATDTLPTELL